MAHKDRHKKDHIRKEKKTKAMRESENPFAQRAFPRHQAKDESNLTDTQPGPGEPVKKSVAGKNV
jgi:hypothetical protein